MRESIYHLGNLANAADNAVDLVRGLTKPLVFVHFAALLDVILMFGAYRSTRLRNISRMLIRFFWFAVLSVVIVVLYV